MEELEQLQKELEQLKAENEQLSENLKTTQEQHQSDRFKLQATKTVLSDAQIELLGGIVDYNKLNDDIDLASLIQTKEVEKIVEKEVEKIVEKEVEVEKDKEPEFQEQEKSEVEEILAFMTK